MLACFQSWPGYGRSACINSVPQSLSNYLNRVWFESGSSRGLGLGGVCTHLITLHRRGSGFVLRVDSARWGQTPEDLRHLAVSAPHASTRERALALFDITQHRCATQVAVRTGRLANTLMRWVDAYNQGGPDALAFHRTGGRRPLFAHSAKPSSARWSAPPSARRPPHPSKGLIQPRAGPCAASSIGSASALG